MKKLALIIGSFVAIALLGAGCAPKASTPTPEQNAPVNNSAAPPATTIPELNDLKDFPALAELATPIDDSAWVTTTTKSAVTIRTPNKGATAPTAWTYAIIDNNDPHLKGGCYVTEATVYKATTIDEVNMDKACQTATEFKDGPGERTDYFVFRTQWSDSKGNPITRTNLLTMTKKYPAGFDMNAYSAAVRHIIRIID